MLLLVRCAWCVVAGLASSLAFPPQDLWWIGWIGLVPWFASLHRARPLEAALLSTLFGFSLALPLGAWIPAVVTRGFGGSAAGGYALWVLAGAAYVPAIVALGVGSRAIPTRSALHPIAVGLGWGLVELSYSRVWPQVPWVLLGGTQIDTSVSALAAAIGVHGVSAVVVATNAMLATLVLRISPVRSMAIAGGVGVAAVLAGASSGPARNDEARMLRVALVQPAIPMRPHPDSLLQEENASQLIALSRGVGRADLLLWPENALSATVEGRPDLAAAVSDLSTELGISIWVGLHRSSPEGRYNSVAVFAPGRKPEAIYDKEWLLPFTERIPAWLPFAARRAWGGLVPPLPFEPGVLHAATIPRSGVFLCFEAAFSGLVRDPRAEVLVNFVNDGWYDRTSAAEHLLLLSRWRAIEAGAPLLRVASTGISAVIRPSGQIAASLPVGAPDTLVSDIRLESRVTPFERLGYAPLILGALLCWGLGLRGQVAARRSSPRSAP